MEIAGILVIFAYKLKNGYYPYVFFNLFIRRHYHYYTVPGCSHCPHRNRSRRILGLRKNRKLGPSLSTSFVFVSLVSASLVSASLVSASLVSATLSLYNN